MGQGLARIAETGDAQTPRAAEALDENGEKGATRDLSDTGAAATSYWNPGGVLGVDVSSHQGRFVDWSSAWRNGARFAYVKATENNDYANPYFSDQYAGAGAAGMYRGAYHFALPSLSSGATQATFFVKNGGGWSADGKTLPPLLDVEYNPYASLGNTCYNMTPSQMVAWIADFSRQMQTLTGRKPMIYTTANWWNECTGNTTAFGDHALHLARYGSTTPGAMPSGWTKQSVWQYTDVGPVVGDWNQWNGDLASLDAFARNTAKTTNPAATAAIAAVVSSAPELGGVKSAVTCGLVNAGCYQNFANGAVIWSSGTGAAMSLNGPIRTAWLAAGAQNGVLGYPKAAQDCGNRDGGCYQSFQKGEIFWSTASGARISKTGPIRTAYRAAGAENGILGYPIGAETCGLKNDGCFQAFQRGEILWSSTTGARISKAGAIRTAYRAAGAENSALGYPITAEICGLKLGGCYQAYQKGEILWSSATGAQISRSGEIRAAYRAAGAENGVLGYPTGKETCGLKNGGCYQSYQNGEIVWSSATGARIVSAGPIRTAYRSAGAENGRLGYPLTHQTCGLKDGGCMQSFQGGEIYFSSTSGAQISRGGSIRTLYRSLDAQNGRLGYPITAEICGLRDGGCYQGFQRGEIYWSAKTGAKMVKTGSIRTAYRAAKAEKGILGYPLTHEICGLKDGGCYQSFQNGEIMWSAKTGARITATGPIRTAYRKAGAENGTLGYPTTNQTCPTTTRCTQSFQRGTLTWTPTGVKRT
ncbi:lysozyme M1 [Arthrobacter pityocampae]|uniref:lysozyme n=1 Tax=Arthrobacter pityocampae TaxID=547334 RepID=A0A2S5J1U7_9MICC|nr:GH25 family lysozyme [Arthrobacter pityocampae]PPB50774.1 lysozyme M1 [Arthrobacter pityocampae]